MLCDPQCGCWDDKIFGTIGEDEEVKQAGMHRLQLGSHLPAAQGQKHRAPLLCVAVWQLAGPEPGCHSDKQYGRTYISSTGVQAPCVLTFFSVLLGLRGAITAQVGLW